MNAESLRAAYTEALLGGPARYTPPEVWRQAGADEALARDMWRAMGFASIPDDEVALTEADVDALRDINAHLTLAGLDPDVAIRFTRLLGQTMGRVADALATLIESAVGDGLSEMAGLESSDPADVALTAASAVLPMVERELQYLFRRHLYAAAMRRIAPLADHEDQVVGFADVVQFTRLSGQMNEADLADLLETFEAETADLITAHGGRVVKLIGDAVMFTVDDDGAAAELALAMVEAFGEGRPDLRVGLGHGEVIARQGDLFGPTVNLASRLVGYARPGTVLIDGPLAEHLADDDRFEIRSLGNRDLKGLGRTAIFVLRRAPAADAATRRG